MCVCVLGAGRGLGGMELRVGSNIMISFLCIIYCSFSYGTCTLYFVCVYIVCIVSSYIGITFMNIITFDYFVFT